VQLVSVFAQNLAAQNGIRVNWDDLQLKIESVSLLKKKIAFELTQPCVRQGNQINACFSQISIEAAVDLKRLGITEIGPIRILGGAIDYRPLHASAPASPTPRKEPFQFELPRFLRLTAFKPIQIEVDKISYISGKDHYSGKFDFHSTVAPTSNLAILFKLAASAGLGPDQTNVAVHLDGGLNAQAFQSKLQFVVAGLSPDFPKFEATQCDLNLAFGARDRLEVNCPFTAETSELPEEASHFDLPKNLNLAFKLKADGELLPPNPAKPMTVESQFEVLPFTTSTMAIQGKIEAKFAGLISQLRTSKDLNAQMNFDIKIPNFQSLVAHLDHSAWSIPAPIRAMNGSIEFSTSGKLEALEAQYPLQFKTRLGADKQKLNLDGTGSFQIDLKPKNPTLHAGIDLLFSDVVLTLPRLELANPPQILSDNRIQNDASLLKQKQAARKSKAPKSFHYDLAIKTPADRPIKILTNLAQGPIPIHLDLKMSDDDPLGGSIRVASFPLKLFRRDSEVDHFNLTLKSPTDQSVMDGSFKVKYTDYTIIVSVISTISKPVVIMTSDPPLPQDQLVATLLFGHPLDELDESQSSSVGNTQAAIKDGAIGLGSMYILASTPVESVNYDSSSGVVTARVHLAEGTSLNVGAQSNQVSQVGVRKMLSKHWSVETDVNQGSANAVGAAASSVGSGTRGSLFLEYSSRY
jgi:hypothetical protein